jgi:hypothetical protein
LPPLDGVDASDTIDTDIYLLLNQASIIIFDFLGAFIGVIHNKFKQKEKPEKSKWHYCQWERRQRKWFPKAGLFILLSHCFVSKKQLYRQHVSLGNLQIHVVSQVFLY